MTRVERPSAFAPWLRVHATTNAIILLQSYGWIMGRSLGAIFVTEV